MHPGSIVWRMAALAVIVAGPASANTLSISDVSLAERDAGTRDFTFTVTLDRSVCTNTVTVQYTTVNESAIMPNDYTARSGSLTFPPQQIGCFDQFESIVVVVNGDGTPESHETFRVVLSQPVNATITDGTGIGTILNDDTYVIANDTTAVEGSGPWWMDFRVSLTHASVLPVSVSYATNDVSANHPEDYSDTSGVLTFSQGEVTKYVKVQVAGDARPEPDENFFLKIANATNGQIIDDTAIGLILDDDQPVGVGDGTGAGFALAPVVPNPMRDRLAIAFSLARPVRVTLAIYGLDGRRVRTLADGSLPAGPHALSWDGRDDRGRPVASGVYFCRLAAGGDVAVRRLAKLD